MKKYLFYIMVFIAWVFLFFLRKYLCNEKIIFKGILRRKRQKANGSLSVLKVATRKKSWNKSSPDILQSSAEYASSAKYNLITTKLGSSGRNSTSDAWIPAVDYISAFWGKKLLEAFNGTKRNKSSAFQKRQPATR